jgi:hypothetical protein
MADYWGRGCGGGLSVGDGVALTPHPSPEREVPLGEGLPEADTARTETARRVPTISLG